MSEDYRTYTADELLDALEHAGRYPDLDLLRVCLERQEELTPGLLELFRKELDEDYEERLATWDNDDPRWYREIHAGHLLLAYREPEALPIFVKYFSDPEYENYLEWFEGEMLGYYGPIAIPFMQELLETENDWVWGRATACSVLGQIAADHPEERGRVLEILRGQLPPLDEDERPKVDQDEVDGDQIVLWTDVAYALARLKDRESEPQIVALFEHELLDEMVFGGLDDYREILISDKERDRFTPVEFDLIETYAGRKERDDYWSSEAAQRRQDQEYEGKTYVRTQPKVGRNDPCPCGSGKKYKHCCGKP